MLVHIKIDKHFQFLNFHLDYKINENTLVKREYKCIVQSKAEI